MAALTRQQKHFITAGWAQFRDMKEIQKAYEERFEVKLKPDQARRYNPELRAGAQMSKELRQFFIRTRERFQTEIESTLPMANKAVRVRKLQSAAEEYEKMGNYKMMADMLEQIAKEMGDVHTNRKEFTGKGGGPIQYQDVTDMTDAQIDQELQSILSEMKEPAR